VAFLGLDVGGTNCRFEWSQAGSLAGGDAPGVQPAVHGVEATVRGLAAVLERAAAVTRPTAAVCALAGAGDPSLREQIDSGLLRAGIRFPVAIVGDVLAAAAAALATGTGVLVAAGTGSFAVARGRDGELVRIGGRGYLLGDQGSGYDLVRRAAAGVLLAIDDLGPATTLTATLTAAFGAPSPQRLGAVLQQLEPGAVAAHLPVVLAAAADGDAVAHEVIEAGVEALAGLVVAVARRAELDLRGLSVTLGGGVLLQAPAITERLAQRLSALGTAAPALLEARAAARGAAWLAHGWHAGLQPQTGWVARVAL